MYLAVLNFFLQDYNVQRDIQKEEKKETKHRWKELLHGYEIRKLSFCFKE